MTIRFHISRASQRRFWQEYRLALLLAAAQRYAQASALGAARASC